MERNHGEYTLSDTPDRMDSHAIHELLKTSYWANTRTIEQVKKSIKNSLCLGLFYNGSQVGFARAVTDYSTFSCICDVIIHKDHRKKGLGKLVMKCLLEHPSISSTRMILVTKDAQKLYEQYGFQKHPYECMIKKEE